MQKARTTRTDGACLRLAMNRTQVAALAALAQSIAAGCSGPADHQQEALGSLSSAATAETDRLRTELAAGSNGTHGFILLEKSGKMLENHNQSFVYDPASSIKVVVAVSLLRELEAGSDYDLDTRVTHFTGSDGSCPTGAGATRRKTLRELVRLTLVQSDNPATRTLIDFLGGFSSINATAQTLGMTSTEMTIYPGCGITNEMTQLDAARLYTRLSAGTLLSDASRAALLELMPANGGDSSGTRLDAFAIVDEEAERADISPVDAAVFKDQLALHYKAGDDAWCDPDCRYFYAISGSAELPSCTDGLRTTTSYAWGLFIHGGTNENNTRDTFFAHQAEPLRRAIREELSSWVACSAPASER